MDLSSRIEKAVKVRESGRLTDSRKLFESIIERVDSNDPDYVRLMGEYVIQLRLEGKETTSRALKLGQELIRKYSDEPAAVRALAHSLIDMGGFELAEPLFKKMIGMYSGNSLKKGEEQAHLSYVFLRVGKLVDAKKLIREAIDNIEKNNANEDYVEVRKSYAYIVKSLVENATGKKGEAKQSAIKALEIAKKGNSVFRIAQVKELLTLFENK